MLSLSRFFFIDQIALLLAVAMLSLQCHCKNESKAKQKGKSISSTSTSKKISSKPGDLPNELNKPLLATPLKDMGSSAGVLSNPSQAVGSRIEVPQATLSFSPEQADFSTDDGKYQIRFTDSTCTEAIVQVGPTSSSPGKEFRLPVKLDPPNMDISSLQSYAAWVQQHMQVHLPNVDSSEQGYVLIKRGGKKNLLHQAAKKDRLDVIKGLVNAGKITWDDINAVDEMGYTPMQVAVRYGHLDIVRYFIEQLGVKVDTYHDLGANPLHAAAAHGYLDIVQYFIEKYKTICIDSQGRKLGFTALHAAIFYTNALELVEYLLKQGASTEIQDFNGNTPLHIAMQKGNLNIISALLQAKANIGAKNKDGDTPLHIAMQKGYIDAVLALLQAGADLHVLNNAGQSPIEVAFAHRNSNLIEQVFQKFGIIDVLGSDRLTHLGRARHNKNEPLAKLLIQLGANKLLLYQK
jgi:ankyrin repeat protein